MTAPVDGNVKPMKERAKPKSLNIKINSSLALLSMAYFFIKFL